MKIIKMLAVIIIVCGVTGFLQAMNKKNNLTLRNINKFPPVNRKSPNNLSPKKNLHVHQKNSMNDLDGKPNHDLVGKLKQFMSNESAGLYSKFRRHFDSLSDFNKTLSLWHQDDLDKKTLLHDAAENKAIEVLVYLIRETKRLAPKIYDGSLLRLKEKNDRTFMHTLLFNHPDAFEEFTNDVKKQVPDLKLYNLLDDVDRFGLSPLHLWVLGKKWDKFGKCTGSKNFSVNVPFETKTFLHLAAENKLVDSIPLLIAQLVRKCPDEWQEILKKQTTDTKETFLHILFNKLSDAEMVLLMDKIFDVLPKVKSILDKKIDEVIVKFREEGSLGDSFKMVVKEYPKDPIIFELMSIGDERNRTPGSFMVQRTFLQVAQFLKKNDPDLFKEMVLGGKSVNLNRLVWLCESLASQEAQKDGYEVVNFKDGKISTEEKEFILDGASLQTPGKYRKMREILGICRFVKEEDSDTTALTSIDKKIS
ncbi:MAG: hypothetical protein JW725_03030 [Candidatus Babeliaceae bacterium]|nr:hypothetical protein [Candidatus Babeliaceae bacterium]